MPIESGSNWLPVSQYFTQITQSSSDTYDSFYAKIKAQKLSYGVFRDPATGGDTFIANLSNDSLKYTDLEPNLGGMNKIKDIYGPNGPSQGNIVTFFAEFDTHYPEIKNYCFESEYYKNSSMEFDFEKLKPTYRFIIGLPGKSNAINISAKLGLEESIIEEASSLLEVNTKENNLFIDKLSESIREYDYKLEYINKSLEEIDEVKETLESNLQKYEEYKESLYNDLSIELNKEIEEKKEEMLEIYKEFKGNTSLKQHELNELLHSMDKSKNNIKLQRKLESEPKFNNSEIQVGDDVLVLSYNQRATVLEISGNTLQIKMGAMKLNIKKKEVRKIDSEPEVAKRYVSTSNVSSKKVGIDINVIGLNTEEAIRKIENYMDKVILQGYDTFTIIHGLGSGILRKNIGEYLKNNRYVASYRTGGQNEGGMGATVVEMK